MFASGKVLGFEPGICCAGSFFGEKAASKNFSAWDFLKRGRAREKRAFASGKILCLVSGLCCARSFFDKEVASKIFSV